MTEGRSFRMLSEDLIGPADEAGRRGLRGMRCGDCGEVFFGRRRGCEYCTSSSLTEVTLSDEGVLHTYTVLKVPPPPGFIGAFKEEGYPIGLVELEEGVRVMAPLEVAPSVIDVGLKMEAVFPEIETEDGETVITYAFKLKEESR